MNTETIIVVIILIIVLIPAFRGVIKHAKGEGECCGGPKEKRVRKKISGTKLYEYVVQIDGMHCINCRNSIEKQKNRQRFHVTGRQMRKP